jgi:AcrR family transcriptional regulator
LTFCVQPDNVTAVTDDRSGPVLDAALTVFGQYGYGKTTMRDVARAAGISRAALYLHFPTKEDLFRAGARRVHARALERADAALAAEGDVVSRVDAAMSAYIGELTATASLHAEELLDAGLSVGGDIVAESQAALHARLTTALGELDLTAIDATAAELARLLLAAAAGLKKSSPNPQVWQENRALFFRMARAATQGASS